MKAQPYSLRIPKDLLDKARTLSHEKYRNLSQTVIDLIREWVEKEEAKKP